MRHCVVSHGEVISAGYEYVYKVLAPVRATLMIRRVSNGWLPGEIALQGNRQVAKEVARSLFETLFNSGYYSGDQENIEPSSKEPDIQEILPRLSFQGRADVELVLKIFGGHIAEVRVPIPQVG